MTAGHAQKGGEYGVNGEFYQGGQFLPESEDTIKGAQKIEIRKGTRKQISPYMWDTAPADNMESIYDRIVHFTIDNRRECQYIKGQGFVGLRLEPFAPEQMTNCYGQYMGDNWYNFISRLADRFNQGERWFPISEDPFHYLNQY
jgi:hypothetical protein